MGYTPWDTYVNTMPIPLTVEELQQALPIKYNADWKTIADTITQYGGDPNNFEDLASLCGLSSTTSLDGASTVWYYSDKVDIATKSIVPTVSTASTNTRTAVRAPINTTVDEVTGKVTASALPKTGSFAQNAIYVLGEIGQATTAANIGIWLGKTIDSTLYNANPDFWDSVGMSSLNPETWGSITAGDTSLGATLFNWIFGIDPDTGNMQGYVDAEAAAYMAYWMQTRGVFGDDINWSGDDILPNVPLPVNLPVPIFAGVTNVVSGFDPRNLWYQMAATSSPVVVYRCTTNLAYGPYTSNFYFSKTPFNYGGVSAKSPIDPSTITLSNAANLYTVNGQPVYFAGPGQGNGYYMEYYDSIPNNPLPDNYPSSLFNNKWQNIGYYLLYGDTTSGVTGIGTQAGANVPDTSTWSDIPTADTYLRSTYPDTYNNALQYDVVQPDGSVLTKTYIPVPMVENLTTPDTSTENDPWNNPQPTSDGGNQNNTLVNVATSPDTFIKELIKTITQTVTLPKTDIDNPTTTGTGDGPTLTPIAGSASALWSVYHPTKAQIDSFGAWLWTDNVIQQFIQLLNNPMEGIITLHKVFAPPVDSGSATIVVGRLDSEVPSATVTQQYVSVDCGSVDVNEYFGNVFDYPPYTTISLYLPFIGFVPLNPDDIMRSTVSISYGVDVFTGACLAMVNVSRDGNNVGMYQYSGVASVEYPLTGAQHSGLVSGLLGVAGGIAGVALASTGVGAVAGAGSIAGGLANFAKSNPARSGGFSGNAGAMGVKIPYIIIERPITKIANNFDILNGYPTNYNVRLGDCSGNVIVKYVHVSGINATDNELEEIDTILKSGVIV